VARSSRGFPRRSGSTRRLTAWGIGTGGTAVTTVASAASFQIGGSIVPAVEGLTVVRIRGFFQVQLMLATAASDGMTGAFGIGIATAAAVAGGMGTVPTPITESGSETWLYHQFFSVTGQQLFAAGAGPGAEQHNTFFRADIDSKSMRKFPDDMSIYAVVEVGTEVGTASIDVHHDSRVLVKLP